MRALAVESPVSAANERCFPSLHCPQPSATDFAEDEFVAGYLREVVLEFDALKSPFACASVRSEKESLSVLTSSWVVQSIVEAGKRSM